MENPSSTTTKFTTAELSAIVDHPENLVQFLAELNQHDSAERVELLGQLVNALGKQLEETDPSPSPGGDPA